MESERLQELHNYCILDTMPDPKFDKITKLAQKLFKCPINLISLVDKNRQWFKSNIGLSINETPREMSFCHHVIMHSDIMIVEDALLDERFKNNPLVTNEPYIRFYAGYPLITKNNYNIGTLCIIDTVPRKFNKKNQLLLKELSSLVVDICEHHKTIIYLEECRLKSEAASRAKSEFLSMMSHELRTPLNAIIGFSELIELQITHNKHLEYLKHIKDSGHHLIEIINDLLDISSIETNKILSLLERIELKNKIELVINTIKYKADQKKQIIQLDLFDCYIQADRRYLRQSLLNIIGNAIKYTPVNGVIKISLLEENEYICIIINDNGYGISSENLKKLGEPFFRITDRMEEISGTGLGITITKKFIQLMNGIIIFESELDKGTTVTIKLKKA